MPTFHEFAWFFQHDHDLGQLRRVRSASSAMSPWFKFCASLVARGGECSLWPHNAKQPRVLSSDDLLLMHELPDDTDLSCGGYCGTLGFSGWVCAGEYGQVTLDAHDVQEHTWPMLWDLLRWISDETRHDVLIVGEYELFDEKQPLEQRRLRYVHARAELVLETNHDLHEE